MAIREGYVSIPGSDHHHKSDHRQLGPTAGNEQMEVTLFVRRRAQDGASPKLREVRDFSAKPSETSKPMSHQEFAASHGANQADLQQVANFAASQGLAVVEESVPRRSVIVKGPVSAVNKAFGVAMYDYESPRTGKYRGHPGEAALPAAIANLVEGITGLDSHKIHAHHFSTARRKNPADPSHTRALTPQQVAKLYNFPDGDGAGQTIGIYEMNTSEGPAGYTTADITDSMEAFGGGLTVPTPIDVSIDGFSNSGQSDGETGLDITVAGAIAQAAKIAVYFTGEEPSNIIHAVQHMIHPGAGDPTPTIVSISYGWGADDADADSFSDSEYTQLGKLFQDAANLSITVLVSSGDSGAVIESNTQAQTSYPATEPWVLACGGTTVGNVNGSSFDEYVWNDTGKAGPGATGGGISARFTTVPDYQTSVALPKRSGTGTTGRGIPDIAGNASENSGYEQFINGESGPVGGTSAVAPLYAGLIARLNKNLGVSVGFINPVLYGAASTVFRDVVGAPGPKNNSFSGVTGYPAGKGWDACTGLGSVNGVALQNALQSARTARV